MDEFLKKTNLKDGKYFGHQSGYKVTLDSSRIRFKADKGIRGLNIPVIVTVTNGEAKVEVNKEK